MTCQYCTAKNDPEDSRCQRCGRRIHSATERPSYHPAAANNSSLARSLSLETDAYPELRTKPAFGPQIVPPQPTPQPQAQGDAYQASLFGPQLFDPSELGKPGRETPRRPPAPKSKVDKNAQQSLDFVGALPLGNHALKTSVEARIYCDTPMAQTPLRVVAALADLTVGLVGVALYLATFRMMGQELVWSGPMLLSYLAAAVVISLFYRVLYCLGNGDTPGARWAGLRLIDFDGRLPTRKQRFQRLAGGCVGALAAGLGLLWALFDEERLTWHDHMSATFPTVRD
ncbi:MAG: RDD family protein [Bryobacteraceae bacterium]